MAAFALLLCSCIRTESVSPVRVKLVPSKAAIRCCIESSSSEIQCLSIRGGSNSQPELEGDGEVDVETSTNSTADNDSQLVSTVELATKLRLEGKEFHDKGDFEKAAELFKKAADSLQQHEQTQLTEDYVTCRLHQALCHLKSMNYQLCLEACTAILQDDQTESHRLNPATSTPAVRARAYHRRAKAKLGLGDSTGALQDARSAAFLGDRKAVALYGRLMRDSPSSPNDQSTFQSPLPQQPSPNSALLESLLNKSNPSSSDSSMPAFSPASLLMGGGTKNLMGALGSGSNGLAKSVVESLTKRLEEEETQTTICNYLKKTNKTQLQQLAAMAGMSDGIRESHLDRLVTFCHSVTPRAIRRTVRTTKGAIYGFKVIRRTVKIINKYKSLLVALLILQWTKSACMRPMPVDRVAAKRATKRALKDAMRGNRKS
jgi:tetratricopeptide (TPR) repeat protein